MIISILFVIGVIVTVNYGITGWIEVLGRKYESRCVGRINNETHFISKETSIGCFCE